MPEDLVRQSVLDRLIGADLIAPGGGAARPPRTWGESVELLEENVLRDLEQLLNTRQISEPAEPPLDHLSRSIFNYGLVDVATLSADSGLTPDEIRRRIKETIELFEPRLTDVDVVDPTEGSEQARGRKLRRTVLFRVEATLRTDPDPEQVEFDTVLEVATKRFKVKAEPHA